MRVEAHTTTSVLPDVQDWHLHLAFPKAERGPFSSPRNLPFVCFVVPAFYGLRAKRLEDRLHILRVIEDHLHVGPVSPGENEGPDVRQFLE